MDGLDFRFLGRDSKVWQKKYFFREIGRGGNPDSAFMLLLVSGRVRSVENTAAFGSALYAKLVGQYGRSHLSDSPRDMVKRLVDIVNAEAVEAKKSRTELAAGFLHFKGNRAAAGSVGRLRAGFAHREGLVATSPLPERARQKGSESQVSLDLGHTVEGDLSHTPAFFIAPAGAMAMGDEHLRKFLWGFVSDDRGLRDSAPADWEHLPCLLGIAPGVEKESAPSAKKRERKEAGRRFAATRTGESIPAKRSSPVVSGQAQPKSTRPRGPSLSALRAALWVALVATIAFLGIKLVFSRSGGESQNAQTGMTSVPVGYESEELQSDDPGGVPGEAAGEGSSGEAAIESESVEQAAPVSIEARALWSSKLGGIITSSPADLGEGVAFGSRDGSVYCLGKADGKVDWKHDGADGFGSSPAVAGERLFIGCYDGNVLCLDARSGSRLWRYKTGGRVVSSPTVTPEGEVLIGSYDGFLYCIKSDGKLKWRFRSGARVWCSPAYSNGRVFFGDLEGRLHCLDVSDGGRVWSKTAPAAVYSSPSVADSRIFFGSSDGTVAAYSAADGERLWKYAGHRGVSSSIGVISGTVVVGFKDGTLAALAPADGARLWTVRLPGIVRSRPVAWNGAIAVTCYDGHVRVLDISDGSTRSDYEAAGKVYATPLVSSDVVYFGDMNGNFTALSITESSRQ